MRLHATALRKTARTFPANGADLTVSMAQVEPCRRFAEAGIPRVGPGRAGGNGIYDWFRYDVVRVWRQPVAAVLGCGLTVLPLAPICDVVPEQVPGVLMAISGRLEQEA